MGHHDPDNTDSTKTDIRLSLEAYEAKRAKQLRDDISDQDIRTYLVELYECSADDRHTSCLNRHVKDVVYDADAFNAAESLVAQDVYDSVYDVFPMTDRGKQLQQMCYDEGWVQQQLGEHALTDDGIDVMLDGDITRTNDPTWDEHRAQQWYKHD